MKIRVEVDVGPKELREFLGLPDVSGLQEEAIRAVGRRLKTGAEGFEPMAVLRGLVPTGLVPTGLLSIEEWQRLILKALERGEPVEVEKHPPGKTRPRARKPGKKA